MGRRHDGVLQTWNQRKKKRKSRNDVGRRKGRVRAYFVLYIVHYYTEIHHKQTPKNNNIMPIHHRRHPPRSTVFQPYRGSCLPESLGHTAARP